MATTDLTLTADDQTTQHQARAAIEAYTSKAEQSIRLEPIPVRRGKRLDVDAVLARSLARVVDE